MSAFDGTLSSNGGDQIRCAVKASANQWHQECRVFTLASIEEYELATNSVAVGFLLFNNLDEYTLVVWRGSY